MLEQLLPDRRHFSGMDPIFAANSAAQRLAATGAPVINAAMGALLDDEGRFVALESVMSVYRELTPAEIAPYAPIAGDPRFLLALVRRNWPALEQYGVGVATPGASGALALSVRNLVSPGGTVLTASPFWGPYLTLTAENGAKLATAPMPGMEAGAASDATTSPDRVTLDVDAWRAQASSIIEQDGRLVVWLNDPCHNPTGRSFSRADRRALIALLEELSAKTPVTLLLDLAYLDYARDPAQVEEALDDYAQCGQAGRVLVGATLSLSKGYTLYGARAGALVFPWATDRALQDALSTSCRGTFSNCARAPMSVLIRMSDNPEALAQLAHEHAQWRALLMARADALDAALKSEGLTGATWHGGFFAALPLPNPDETTARLAEQGVFVVPLPMGIRVGLCGLRVADAPRFATALRASL